MATVFVLLLVPVVRISVGQGGTSFDTCTGTHTPGRQYEYGSDKSSAAVATVPYEYEWSEVRTPNSKRAKAATVAAAPSVANRSSLFIRQLCVVDANQIQTKFRATLASL
eukprot:scaffold44126_cov17-Prasinocladus_malaysianus.AAC.1